MLRLGMRRCKAPHIRTYHFPPRSPTARRRHLLALPNVRSSPPPHPPHTHTCTHATPPTHGRFHFNELGDFMLVEEADGWRVEASFAPAEMLNPETQHEASFTSALRVWSPTGETPRWHAASAAAAAAAL